MSVVSLSVSNGVVAGSGRLLRELERRLRSSPAVASATRAATRLHLTSRPLPGAYVVSSPRGVAVSTCDAERLCRCAGIARLDYLLAASVLGMAQARVLRENPLLRLEDLRHPPSAHCVFARARTPLEFAARLDPAVMCPGCAEFYTCLGAESELIALHEIIAELNASRARAAAEIPLRRN